jgi:hypothetical protein
MARITFDANATQGNTFELLPHLTPVVAVITEAKYATGTKADGSGDWHRINITTEIEQGGDDNEFANRKIWDGFWLPGEMAGIANIVSFNMDADPVDLDDTEVDTDELIASLIGTRFSARVAQVYEDRKTKKGDSQGNVTVTKEKVLVNKYERQDQKWNAQLLAYDESDYNALVAGVTPEDAMPFRA